MRNPLSSPLIGSELQITEVQAHLLRVPLPGVVHTGTTTVTHRDYVVVRIATDTSLDGVAWGLARGADLVTPINKLYGPAVIGRDPQARQELSDELLALTTPHFGRSDVYKRALSLVDIALWDLAAKALDCSLAMLLGVSGRKSVPAMAASGYYGEGNEIRDLREHYEQLGADGYALFKIMVGAQTAAQDADRVSAAAEACGRGSIAIDANAAWNTPSEALHLIDLLDCRVEFLEEPFHPDNERALTRFRELSAVPIANGEFESSRHALSRAIGAGLVDIVRLDATVIGGISAWLNVAAVAEAANLAVLPHYFPALHAPLVAATSAAEMVEVIPDSSGAENFSELLVNSPQPSGGQFPLSEGPGLGLTWNWQAIEQYTVSHH